MSLLIIACRFDIGKNCLVNLLHGYELAIIVFSIKKIKQGQEILYCHDEVTGLPLMFHLHTEPERENEKPR